MDNDTRVSTAKKDKKIMIVYLQYTCWGQYAVGSFTDCTIHCIDDSNRFFIDTITSTKGLTLKLETLHLVGVIKPQFIFQRPSGFHTGPLGTGHKDGRV